MFLEWSAVLLVMILKDVFFRLVSLLIFFFFNLVLKFLQFE